MRIKVLYENNVFLSKNIESTTESDSEAFAEKIYQSINTMDRLKIETPNGWVILPEKVLKNSVIFIESND